MKLDHISLSNLKPSPLNVRKKGGKDIADLLPSIRSLGIIQPLLVRPNCEGFEIVAGQRRYNALTVLAEEGIAEPVPCIVMQEGDDAAAIEASLVENIARLPMDEIDQYKAFAALIAKGESVEAIGARFGVTERLVHQRLAIAGIMEPILNAYRREDITPDTLRALTLATPRQQKAWWKLYKSKDEYAPTGRLLREWLFGGSQIPLTNALFNVSEYAGPIVSDLFGEEQYFGDAGAFWSLQSKAIVEARDRYLDAGWSEVAILEIGEYWQSWDHVRTTKTKGGKIFFTCTKDGEVQVHEGYLSAKEAARRKRAGTDDAGADKPQRPEITKAMQNYLGLHKHAAVRCELLAQPGIALRLAVAHLIIGSPLWRVEPEEGRADKKDIGESVASSKAARSFAEATKAARHGIGSEQDDDASFLIVRHAYPSSEDLADLFQRLLAMDDQAVMGLLTHAMAESLAAHHPLVDLLGAMFATDMREWWTPDQVFFDLLRDKEALGGMIAELAGKDAANAHLASTAKVQKKIITDCLDGTRKAEIENWLPAYMAFPGKGYTGRYE